MQKILLGFIILFFYACSNEEKKSNSQEIQTENVQIEQSDSNIQINDDTLPLPIDDEVKDENASQG
ncbi:cytochrome C [Campylobacter sp.]|uniref:cytochrome C n=1 Tax=Campylobacter sp. TaxID=205 RepID=UPI0025C739BD|nr:cytochrome C [Campylobacter sp.]